MTTLLSTTDPFHNSFKDALQPLPDQNGKRNAKWNPTQKKLAEQQGYQFLSVRDPLRNGADGPLEVEKKVFELLKNPVCLARQYKDLIEHHVAMRVGLFFQQAVMCYKTPFQYEIADTEGQFLTASALQLTSGEEVLNIPYQAAHSSTIPSLKACVRKDFLEGNQPQYFSFFRETHQENLHNSTVGLPAFVNKVDILIDGKSKLKDGLRGKAIDLLNQAAQAELTPVEATRRFLDCFEKQVDIKRKENENPEKEGVLKIYKEQIEHMKNEAAVPFDTIKPHSFFDSLLNLNVNNENPRDIPIIRKIVFKKKLQLIQQAQLAEAKILNLFEKAHPKLTPSKKHTAKLALVYAVKNDKPLRRILEKLFCLSVTAIKKDANLCKRLTKHFEAHAKKNHDFLREIRVIVRDFQKVEQCFQATLLRDFRTKLRNLTQTQLANKIKEIINRKILKEQSKEVPDLFKLDCLRHTPISQSTVSRLENSRMHILKNFKTPENQRRKALTLQHARIICKALGVEPGHFFCSFFASKES